MELEDGQIVMAPIRLGDGATLDVHSGVSGDTVLESGAFLTARSSLRRGERIPNGERWDGIPARPAGRAPGPPALPAGTRGKNYLYNLSLSRMERYLDAVSLFPARELQELLAHDGAAGVESSFSTALREGRGLDPLSRLQDFDLQTYLPGDILTKLDRMSMAVSLEARVPLLDHPLVEFACALPADCRMRGDEAKYLLKRALRGRVPDAVLTRPKQGFGVPLSVWFSRILPTFFRDRLGEGSRLREVGVRPHAVRALLDIYEARRRPDHCGQLWGLLVLDSALGRLLGPGIDRSAAATDPRLSAAASGGVGRGGAS